MNRRENLIGASQTSSTHASYAIPLAQQLGTQDRGINEKDKEKS